MLNQLGNSFIIFTSGVVRNTMWPVNTPSKHETLTQCWSNSGPLFATLAQHQNSTGSMPRVCWAAGLAVHTASGDYKPTPIHCLLNVGLASPVLRQYPFIPSQCFMLEAQACWRYRQHTLNQSWANVSPQSVTLAHIRCGAKHDMVTQYWANVGAAS